MQIGQEKQGIEAIALLCLYDETYGTVLKKCDKADVSYVIVIIIIIIIIITLLRYKKILILIS
jgi:hypothetical protein